jgi:translation initiation factor IF-2
MKVSELAKELGYKAGELVELAKEKGIIIKSARSTIDDDIASMVRSSIPPKPKKVRPRAKKAKAKPEEKQQIEPQEVPVTAEDKQEVLEKGPEISAPVATGVTQVEPQAPPKELIPEKRFVIRPPVTVKTLSQVTGIKANLILKKLMDHGIITNINSSLDERAIEIISLEFGCHIEVKRAEPEETLLLEDTTPDHPDDLLPRAPVVTFMGHVDHGKTSLLDCIRNTQVAVSEVGGITQRIGAYKVKADDKHVVFLDTPGHEAFTAMRARGAHVTDVVVLVVAADDGVMPQTEEAIAHARAAGVPIVVAINKVDKKEANVSRVKHQLAQLGLIPEEWGGKTVFVEVSALTNYNIDKLVEMLSLEAELLELKANPRKPARGVVLDASKSETKGIIAHALIQNGRLRRGDWVLCGKACGRIRAIYDEYGRSLNEALFSTPVQLVGLDEVPEAGDQFCVVKDPQLAKSIATQRKQKAHQASLSERAHISLENIFSHIESGKVKEIRIIIKADVKGSIEVLRGYLKNLSSEEVKIKILHSGVGNVNGSDVLLADASDAIIIGFNVKSEEHASNLAKEKGVQIKIYQVVYEVTEELKAALEGLLEPERAKVPVGRCMVKQVFAISRVGNIAGCMVSEGKVERGAQVSVIRDRRAVFEGKIESLKRFKEDVKEVTAGLECGIKISGFEEIRVGDIIEVFVIKEVARRLK